MIQTGAALTITRRFAAPPALVFRLWTDPAHAVRWWGPADHPAVQLAMDPRPGGAWRATLRTVADGNELHHHGVFQVVAPNSLLTFTFAWTNAGWEHEHGAETLVTIRFEPDGDGTLMHFHQAPFAHPDNRDGHGAGWISSFDRLEAALG